MKQLVLFLYAILTIITLACNNGQKTGTGMDYPVTAKDSTIDEYFGVNVPDPYRWMENDTASEVRQWVEAQNKVTFAFLESIPFRDTLKSRLTAVWDYEKQSAPFREGNRWFYYRNDGLQNQSILYVVDSLNGIPRVFIDPNKLSEDGTISLVGLGASHDGKYIAYSIAKGGSDWNEIFVKELDSGELLTDHLEWVKFSSLAWYKDGFFYSRYDAPVEGTELSGKNTFHKIYYHKLGTPQEKDILIFENKNEALRTFYGQVTQDERFLIVYESAASHGNALHVRKLDDGSPSGKFTQLTEGFNYEYSVIDNLDNDLIIKTNFNAPHYRLVRIDFDKRDTSEWKEILPEKEDVLETCSTIGGKIVAVYMHKAHSCVEVYDTEGTKEYDIEMPTLGSISGFIGKMEDTSAFYTFSSFTMPNTVYRFDFNTRESSVYFSPRIDFNGNEYETHQVFFKSKDGTDIPMFLCHKKGLIYDGNSPAVLYGYGGFNISLTPSFRMRWLVWLENGGILAVANLRGGGEFGEEWHKAGTKLNKQNVFDDCIAAAEYLISEKYTSPEKLAIRGGSNGGLLVGAVINRRPDLFRVALPAVGVMDMLRFHKFTIGWNWVGDYGCSDDSVQFHNLISYSPLHNIREDIKYPAVLVTTADHDDRVVPAHSFKYIATLQEKYKGPNPVMIRVDVMAGHGSGKPTNKTIEEEADVWAFTMYCMGMIPCY
ncbi:MAG: prolyl oligopeptidase family serine peptidase [Bacteroidetes bacterium]|nr:prolyl oligopeptidase family serine peptidase [Bacteroidota bacterium]